MACSSVSLVEAPGVGRHHVTTQRGAERMLLSVPAQIGYAALAGFVVAESAGVPVPGETALLAAGLLAGTGQLSLPIVIAVATAAAIVGDNVGYIPADAAAERCCRATAASRTTVAPRSRQAIASMPDTAPRPSSSVAGSAAYASSQQ